MKTQAAYGNIPNILFFTKDPEDASRAKKTLSHVYPGISVSSFQNEDEVTSSKPSFLIVDTNSLSKDLIEHLIECLTETPVVIVAKDFAEVRTFSHLMSGRRAIITRADLDGMGLIQAVHHLIERQQLHEQLARTSQHLKEITIRDELTHLFNHHHMDDILASEVKKANRYKRPLSLVIVAIKNFTAINEVMGHLEGDRIIIKAAELICKTVREVDITARYGDNEFSIILPESGESAAALVAKRIQDALAEITFTSQDNTSYVSTSTGVATLSNEVRTKEDLIRTSLSALIEAKKNGANSICTLSDISSKRRELHENRQLIEQLSERITKLTIDMEHSYFHSIMKTMGDTIQAKKLIGPHSERVAFFAQRIAERLGLGEAEVRSIHRAGILHDIGKLAIDPAILAKPEKLSSAEYELVKQHPLFATEIIGNTSLLAKEVPAILHHHERYDGLGYPEGIKGENIPLTARIIAIAEAWDTMLTSQSYRANPLELEIALSELKKGAGSQFDPDLVDKFTMLITG